MLSDCQSLNTYSRFSVVQQSNSDVCRLIVKVSRSHTDMKPVLLFRTSD